MRRRLGGRTRAWDGCDARRQAWLTLAVRGCASCGSYVSPLILLTQRRVWAGILVGGPRRIRHFVTLLRSIAGEVSIEGALPQEQSDVNAPPVGYGDAFSSPRVGDLPDSFDYRASTCT